MTTSAQSTWDILLALGFNPDPSVYSEPPPGLRYDFGNLRLAAFACTNLQGVRVIVFSGVYITRREAAEVQFEMPEEVESFQQGVAWVTDGLDRAAGPMYQPAVPVSWLSIGRDHRHLLPFQRMMAAYAARPQCTVEREWARIVLRKLGEAIEAASDEAQVILHFDGQILRVWFEDQVIPAPASGDAWRSRFALSVGRLRRLPKRLMRSFVHISIWEESLSIGSWAYGGVEELAEPRTQINGLRLV